MQFRLQLEPTVLGLHEAQFLDVSSQKESVRDKAIAKKWIYLERITLHRQGGDTSEG